MKEKNFDFLKEHEYFKVNREFSDSENYVFNVPEKDIIAVIQVPTTTDGNWDYYYSGDENEMESWFKELLDESKEIAKVKFRIRQLLEGKIEKAKSL